MKNEKLKLIAYWFFTVPVAANYAMAGVMYLQKGPQVVEGAQKGGYPLFFFSLLGVWKLIAAVVLVIPRTPLFKEWAYAGILINLTGAAFSNYMVNFGIEHVIFPLAFLVVAALSWHFRPASRRFSGPLI